MACSACDTMIDFRIGLGRSSQRSFLKRFDILQPVAHLVAQLEEQRTARFGAPALQVASLSRQRSASSVWVMHRSVFMCVLPQVLSGLL